MAGWCITAISMVSNRPVTLGRIASSTKAPQHRGGAAADRDGEVVGPEPHQALAERRGGGQGVVQLGAGLGLEQRRHARAGPAGGLVSPVEAQRFQAGRGAGRRVDAGGVGLAQLVVQPGGRVGGQRLLATAAQAEADQRLCGA